MVRAVLAQLKPFFEIKPQLFYIDLLITGVIAWGSFAALQIADLHWGSTVFFFIVSYVAFYRGLAFIHEAVHFHKRVKGLRLLYNLLFGFPARVPFFIHDPHRYHHLPSTFGTAQDPEYAYLAGSGVISLLKPFLVGLLSPLLLALRFGVLPLISWSFPKAWQVTLYQYASTIVVNPQYKRPIHNEQDLISAQREEWGCALFFALQIGLILVGTVSSQLILFYWAMMSLGAFVNVWRARIAHRYDNPGEFLSPLAQLRDSVTVENGVLSSLWAPAGMQYHSLHHLAPQIPFHNLKPAHDFLKSHLDTNHPYRQTVVDTPMQGLELFYKTVMTSK